MAQNKIQKGKALPCFPQYHQGTVQQEYFYLRISFILVATSNELLPSVIGQNFTFGTTLSSRLHPVLFTFLGKSMAKAQKFVQKLTLKSFSKSITVCSKSQETQILTIFFCKQTVKIIRCTRTPVIISPKFKSYNIRFFFPEKVSNFSFDRTFLTPFPTKTSMAHLGIKTFKDFFIDLPLKLFYNP